MSTKKLFLYAVMAAAASCGGPVDRNDRYIEDTVVHEADSPLIPDKSMVPGPDTVDRNLDDPTTKEPDPLVR